MRFKSPCVWLFWLAVLVSLAASPVRAAQIGAIAVCYACDGDGTYSTGDAATDAAVAANPATAYDGIMFIFRNTSVFPITAGVFSVSGDASPADSFALPTIAAGTEFILIPGVNSDGGTHPSGGLFEATGVTMDTSDGDGGVDDSTIFKFTGTSNGQAVTSITAGTSTAVAGTFTPGDAGLIKPWITPSGGSTSFVGDGPDGDTGCEDCYYGVVATLNAGAGSTGSGLQFTTTSLPSGTVGVAYSAAIGATGGVSPYTFIATGLPAGIVLSAGGTLSGTPVAPGGYIFSAKVTDSTATSVVGSFTVTFAPAPITISTPSPLPSGMSGVPYPAQYLAASGGTGGYAWSITGGSLPTGLTLTPDGTVSGIPTVQGSFSITVTATDTAGTKAGATLALTIRAPAADLFLSAGSFSFSLIASSTTLPGSRTVAVQSTQASQQITYTASVSPAVTWLAVTNGPQTPDAMSVGLTGGALSLAAGTYQTTVNVNCTSSVCSGRTQSIAVTLKVATAPPLLQVLSDLLTFGTTTANLAPISQALNITNAGGGSLAISSVTCEAAWCTVGTVPTSLAGGASAAIPITVNPTTTGPGFFRTQVDISTSGGTGSVPVVLFVASTNSLTLAPAGSQFIMPQGGAPGLSKGSFLVTTTSTAAIPWTATLLPGAPWLLPGVTSGTSSAAGSSSATFSIDPVAAGKLAAGPYYGRIEITAPGVSNSPQEFIVILNVTPATTPVTPQLQPAGLLFLTSTGVNPPSQSVTAYSGSPAQVSFQADATAAPAWLSVSPGTGTAVLGSPGVTNVSVNVTGLKPGVYRGNVNYAFAGAAVPAVNVTLIVSATAGSTAPTTAPTTFSLLSPPPTPAAAGCTPAALVPAQTGLVNNFSAPAAWPTPLAILLYNDCGLPVNNGQIVATFTNGDAPLILTLADPTQGLYSATWTPRKSTPQITINAQATAPGLASAAIQLTGVVTPNSAPVLTPHGTLNGFDPLVGSSLAPGTIVQIYGQNLFGPTPVQPATLPLPTAVNGTSVIIGGIQAPLFYVSATQVNAQIPFELQGNQQYQILAQANSAITTPDTIQLTAATPGIAAFSDSTIIAQHADGSLVSQTSPAKSSEYLVAYLVGLGPVNQPVADGAASPSAVLAQPLAPPVLTINGATYPLLFAGLTPGLVGLYQMNFQVPAGLPAGNLTLAVTQNSNTSNQVTMPYQP